MPDELTRLGLVNDGDRPRRGGADARAARPSGTDPRPYRDLLDAVAAAVADHGDAAHAAPERAAALAHVVADTSAPSATSTATTIPTMPISSG
ncbi:hypothetical protein AB5I41_26370 [Sphingomonas sp. MMS24-JH45]